MNRTSLVCAAGVLALGVVLAVSGSGGAAASGGPGQPRATLAPAFGDAASGGRVIVVLKTQHSGLNLRTHAKQRATAARADQAPLVASMRASGGTALIQLTAPNAVAARLSAAEVARLRADPAVAEVVPDAQLTVLGDGGARIGTRSGGLPLASAARDRRLCPANPARPFVEPEALADIHASADDPSAGRGEQHRDRRGRHRRQRRHQRARRQPELHPPDGAHVVLDAPNYSADNSDGEYYGDASSIAAQGTVVYDYSGSCRSPACLRGARSPSRVTRPARRWSTRR